VVHQRGVFSLRLLHSPHNKLLLVGLGIGLLGHRGGLILGLLATLGFRAVLLQDMVLPSRMLGQGGLAAEALFAAIDRAPVWALASVNAPVSRQAGGLLRLLV
jgi:hypothetical protein